MNNGVCVLGSSWSENEVDYYGLLEEVLELEYFGVGNKVALFKCQRYDISDRGARVYPRFGIVEINIRRALDTNDPFILAQQAQQVYYTTFPSTCNDRRDWRAVCKTKARSRINIPLVGTQSENDQEGIQDPFQEEIRPSPHEIPMTCDLDISHLLVDNTANQIEILPSEVIDDSMASRRNIEIEQETEDEEEEFEDLISENNNDQRHYDSTSTDDEGFQPLGKRYSKRSERWDIDKTTTTMVK